MAAAVRCMGRGKAGGCLAGEMAQAPSLWLQQSARRILLWVLKMPPAVSGL